MSNVLTIGKFSDTAPTLSVTILRAQLDSDTDLANVVNVVLALPDGTSHPVTARVAVASMWVGTIVYTSWFTDGGLYPVKVVLFFADGTQMTIPDPVVLQVGK